MSILDLLKTSADVRQLNCAQLQSLSSEIRNEIISVVGNNGGHLSSNLGIVETTVSLYHVFDFPKDKLIFDVGHQCYAHKILSDRKDTFSTIRTDGGLAGFPDREESVYDPVTTGHAGTSIASGLGLCHARDMVGDDYTVINVVGDGSLVNGLNLEAMFSSQVKPKNYIVILNDNGMSISKNKNGFYGYISKKTASMKYVKSKNAIKKIFGNTFMTRFLIRVKNLIKRVIKKGVTFEDYGFKYVGVVDGNDTNEMVRILQRVKRLAKERAVFLHIRTQKGKGHEQAEERSDLYHGVGKNMNLVSHGFSKTLGEKLSSLVEQDDKIVAVVAGMKDGTGLSEFSEKYPKNFIDVGIAEEYAVTLSAGMAIGGLKPVVAIYSTFMQRAYDQILHDVCLQNLPVVFCLDRAGLVGEDGKTHQGVFDLSYLSHLPNMTVLCPNSDLELKDAIDYALTLNSPVAIRYPKSYNQTDREFLPLTEQLWQTLSVGKDITLLCVGPRMLQLAQEFKSSTSFDVGIVSVRSVKPLDNKVLDGIKTPIVFTLEENSLIGGFGSLVSAYYTDKNKKITIKTFGVKDQFVKNGSVLTQLEFNGLSVDNLLKEYNQLITKGEDYE
ncbi:MAG: 1-deoxy-D-xylulose-5-phosphate synthase [Clostridia bacterium]|nr:1-deoxy-D-xylulose-5-phosphate synthase [Clostridia bacterium]